MFDFLNTYSTPIKVACVIACALACFFFGYDKAETEYLLQIETMKLEHAQSVIDAQNKAKVQYEEEIQKLARNLANIERIADDRMRQLTAYRNADRDMETCNHERGELASLAIEGEQLLKEADVYFGSIVK